MINIVVVSNTIVVLFMHVGDRLQRPRNRWSRFPNRSVALPTDLETTTAFANEGPTPSVALLRFRRAV